MSAKEFRVVGMTVLTYVCAGILILAIITGALFLGAVIWYYAWNAVVPGVFRGPRVTFAQAFWIWVIITAIGGAFKSQRGK